ncbi:MAG: DUF1015 domain-containing protein [Clostridiales bacterium]|nr:DUF1015 domain-containing protein [Clostridiales bacterium]
MLFRLNSQLPVAAPEILLPATGIDLYRWSVIACDQFTSEPEYWNETEEIVGDAPSTLRMVLPEVFLETLSESEIGTKIDRVNASIDEFLSRGLFRILPPGFILVDRKTAYAPSRKGLMLALDLERYDFTPGTREPIRSTEGTVLSRIPPRVRIRENASIELPHIMVLIDDPDRTVIEPAYDALSGNSPVYDTELMLDGGHLKGFYCEADSPVAEAIVRALTALFEKSGDGFLFAAGDGNHSLATAKAHWENVRGKLSAEEKDLHPARYALVEAVNIHDEGLDFEPIYRVVFGLTLSAFREKATRYFNENGFALSPLSGAVSPDVGDWTQKILVTNGSDDHLMTLSAPSHPLPVGSLQMFLDDVIAGDDSLRVDYIHGEDAVRKLTGPDSIGFILPDVPKHSFFQTISDAGVFPRKTFSMGHAREKRYYMEARMITEFRKESN